jgi:hypothetical protein
MINYDVELRRTCGRDQVVLESLKKAVSYIEPLDGQSGAKQRETSVWTTSLPDEIRCGDLQKKNSRCINTQLLVRGGIA